MCQYLQVFQSLSPGERLAVEGIICDQAHVNASRAVPDALGWGHISESAGKENNNYAACCPCELPTLHAFCMLHWQAAVCHIYLLLISCSFFTQRLSGS